MSSTEKYKMLVVEIDGKKVGIPLGQFEKANSKTKFDLWTDGTLSGKSTEGDPLRVTNPVPPDGVPGYVLTKTLEGLDWLPIPCTVQVAKILDVSSDQTMCRAQCLDRNAEATGEILENIRLLGSPGIDENYKVTWEGLAGINWMSRSATVASSRNWRSVCHGNGTFVAVGSTGSKKERVMRSTDGGQTWKLCAATYALDWKEVCFGNHKFVAVATVYDSTANKKYRAMYSDDDGETWESCSSLTAHKWDSVCYGEGSDGVGMFAAVGEQNAMFSTNAKDWTIATRGGGKQLPKNAMNNNWRSVCFGNGMWVAVASNGTHRVMTSADGKTWTAQSAAKAFNSKGQEINCTWRSVCYGTGMDGVGRFVAVANNGGGHVMTSTDGITWQIHVTPAAHKWESVCCGNGLYVAVAISGAVTRVTVSPDGENWYRYNAAADNEWRSVCYGNGRFIAVAASGTHRVMVSDGTTTVSDTGTWEKRVAGQYILVVEQDGQKFAVLQGGTLMETSEENIDEPEEYIEPNDEDEEEEDDSRTDFYSHLDDEEAHKPLFDAKQDKITATGTANLLTAPAVAGGQPGTKAVSDFATAVQCAKADTAYQKPSTGIPKTDLASAVQTSLEKADTALQSFTETDPTVSAWAKAASKPAYTASEVGAAPADASLAAETGSGTDMATSAVASATVTSLLQTIWNKIRQLVNGINGKQNNVTGKSISNALQKVTTDSQGHVTASSDVATGDLPSHTHAWSQITSQPTIPTVNNGTLNLRLTSASGTVITSFAANQSTDANIAFAAGSNVTLTQSSGVLTIAATNTTYSNGTGILLSGTTFSVSYGTTAGTACQGNDSRLSDARTPVSHASTATTYGAASKSNYGHMQLSDDSNADEWKVRTNAALCFNALNGGTVNLNNYRWAGEWMLSQPATAANFPSTGTWTGTYNGSYLKVTAHRGDQQGTQTLYGGSENAMWFRSFSASGTFTAWKRIATADEIKAGGITSITVSAGTGMSGGGTVTSSGTITITLGTPSSCSPSTANTVSGTTHTHTITGCAPADHSSSSTTYGQGTQTNYGHLKQTATARTAGATSDTLSLGSGFGQYALSVTHMGSQSSINLNNFTAHGDFLFYTVSTRTNFPALPTGANTSNACFHLEVRQFGYDNTNVRQRLIMRGTATTFNAEFTRQNNGGTWTAWKRTLNEDDIVTVSTSDFVTVAGTQTITGTKTFSVSPAVPNKTSAPSTSGTAIFTEGQGYNRKSFYVWETASNLTNISSISGMVVGDCVVNLTGAARTMLGLTANYGDILKAASATAGTIIGNLRGGGYSGANVAQANLIINGYPVWLFLDDANVAKYGEWIAYEAGTYLICAVGGGGNSGDGSTSSTNVYMGGEGGSGGLAVSRYTVTPANLTSLKGTDRRFLRWRSTAAGAIYVYITDTTQATGVRAMTAAVGSNGGTTNTSGVGNGGAGGLGSGGNVADFRGAGGMGGYRNTSSVTYGSVGTGTLEGALQSGSGSYNDYMGKRFNAANTDTVSARFRGRYFHHTATGVVLPHNWLPNSIGGEFTVENGGGVGGGGGALDGYYARNRGYGGPGAVVIIKES